METIRSFIAIELPDKLKEELIRLEGKLKSKGSFPVKWVDPSSIHLTLKFLGDVAADRIEEITGALEGVTREVSPFRLEVRELGVFPNLRRVQIVWVGVSGEVERLSGLQQRIEAGMALLGFPRESRPFTAHLTLARVRDRATPEERQQLGQIIAGTKFEATAAIEVEAVNLMKSQLTPQGPIYTKISSVKLLKPRVS